jgi:carbamate kinase
VQCESHSVLTVLALGGNALLREGERGTAAEQRANLRRTLDAAAELFASGSSVVTHGNGPQVGNELLRQEAGAREVPQLPLWLAVALTQGEIGSLLVSELRARHDREAAAVLTHVEVDPDDPAFTEPTKPVGPFYDEAQAAQLREERGWTLAEDAGRGFRRVVPSPEPRLIVELDAIRALVATGTVVVAAGGGGVPVVRRGTRLEGADAVIDKDLASTLLAVGLGADRLVVLTQVDAVYRGFGTPDQEAVAELRLGRDDGILDELPAGSMRPKVAAAFRFVQATGGEALVTSADAYAAGGPATRIVP